MRSDDRPEILFTVACDVIESVLPNSTDSVTSQSTLNSIFGRSTDRSKMWIWTFVRHFLSAFLMTISIKKWSSTPFYTTGNTLGTIPEQYSRSSKQR